MLNLRDPYNLEDIVNSENVLRKNYLWMINYRKVKK